MMETHEEDDPHSDNLFCLEKTVSNVMPAVWRSTMDSVAMNCSSCGMAYCQGNTSYIWRASRKFLVCRAVKLLLVPHIGFHLSGVAQPPPHNGWDDKPVYSGHFTWFMKTSPIFKRWRSSNSSCGCVLQ